MKPVHFVIFLFLVVTTTSCISTKQLTYFQEDSVASDTLMFLKKLLEPYRLQVHDLLSIRIKVLDQETVGIFNPISDANPNATGEEKLY